MAPRRTAGTGGACAGLRSDRSLACSHAATGALRLATGVFAFGAIAVLAEQRVIFEPGARVVARQITLGRLRLWSSRQPLSDFAAIATWRLPAGTPQAGSDLVHVGLRRSSGRSLAVRYFSTSRGRPCPEAEVFARRLSAETSLPLA